MRIRKTRILINSIRGLSLAIFTDLNRILVIPGVPGSITLEGYVPTSSIDQFKSDFGVRVLNVRPLSKRGAQDPYVPSLFVNSRVISLFEGLTLMKGVPRYNEIDPHQSLL